LVGGKRPTLNPTALQQILQDLAEILARARHLDQKGRGAFAPIASMMLVQSFAAELVLAEAEKALRRAA
jgi:hypothetical protein